MFSTENWITIKMYLVKYSVVEPTAEKNIRYIDENAADDVLYI